MNMEPRVDVLAAALADRSRCTIVCALMDGRAYTAKELAYRARITPQTASFHLQRLVDAGLLICHPQGRHRYYHVTNAEIAAVVESMMVAAPAAHLRRHKSRASGDVTAARHCYDHLAGRLGVAVADRIAELGCVLSRGGDFSLTPLGIKWLADIGIDPDGLGKSRRPLMKQCMDWTERRFHVAGDLGNALLSHFRSDGWLKQVADTRALAVTPKGQELFRSKIGIDAYAAMTGPPPVVEDGAASAGAATP